MTTEELCSLPMHVAMFVDRLQRAGARLTNDACGCFSVESVPVDEWRICDKVLSRVDSCDHRGDSSPVARWYYVCEPCEWFRRNFR